MIKVIPDIVCRAFKGTDAIRHLVSSRIQNIISYLSPIFCGYDFVRNMSVHHKSFLLLLSTFQSLDCPFSTQNLTILTYQKFLLVVIGWLVFFLIKPFVNNFCTKMDFKSRVKNNRTKKSACYSAICRLGKDYDLLHSIVQDLKEIRRPSLSGAIGAQCFLSTLAVNGNLDTRYGLESKTNKNPEL